MAIPTQFFVIVVDRPSDRQREAVHQRIKKATQWWWHQYADTWIVGGGGNATDWSKRLQPVFKNGASSVLVFRLPGQDETQSWAYFGPHSAERIDWLHKYYTQDKR
jgi:hypothetical protein